MEIATLLIGLLIFAVGYSKVLDRIMTRNNKNIIIYAVIMVIGLIIVLVPLAL